MPMLPHGSRVSSKISMAHALLIGRSERQAAGAGEGHNIIPIPAADQPQWDWLPLHPCFYWSLKYERAGRSSFSETCLAAFLIVGWKRKEKNRGSLANQIRFTTCKSIW